jgi:diphthamide synthase (EF-2-diphthine--ammonia ligase)
LVFAQAERAALPLWQVPIPSPCPNEEYERQMSTALALARVQGVTHVAFGDLFLEDVRRYREDRMAGTGIEAIFPLWGRPTRALAEEMLAAGVAATITCVDPKQIDRQFAGRRFDASLLSELPATADPCGENGEFHSFVHAGPMFSSPIEIQVGEIVERDGFVFADVTS